MRRLARETFVRVGCAGLARVDFFVEGERVLVNELNTLPGFTQTSVYPKLWEETGLPFPRAVRPPARHRARPLPRRARRPRVLGSDPLRQRDDGLPYDRGAKSVISEIFTRSAPGGEPGDPHEVVAVALAR